nr:polyprotein [synthetic construct]
MAEVYSFVAKTAYEKRMKRRFGTDKWLQFREQCPLGQVRKCWTHFKISDGACFAYLLVNLTLEGARAFLKMSAGNKRLVMDRVRKSMCSGLHYNSNMDEFECECGFMSEQFSKVCEDCENSYKYTEANLLHNISQLAAILECNISEIPKFSILEIEDEIAFYESTNKTAGPVAVAQVVDGPVSTACGSIPKPGCDEFQVEGKVVGESEIVMKKIADPELSHCVRKDVVEPVQQPKDEENEVEKKVKSAAKSVQPKEKIQKVWRPIHEKPKKIDVALKNELKECLDLAIKIGDFIINPATFEAKLEEKQEKFAVHVKNMTEEEKSEEKVRDFKYNFKKAFWPKEKAVKKGPMERSKMEHFPQRIVDKIESGIVEEIKIKEEVIPGRKMAMSRKKQPVVLKSRVSYPVEKLCNEIGRIMEGKEIEIINKRRMRMKAESGMVVVQVGHMDGSNPNQDLTIDDYSEDQFNWIMDGFKPKVMFDSDVVPGTSGMVYKNKRNDGRKYTIIRGRLEGSVVDARDILNESERRRVRNYSPRGMHLISEEYRRSEFAVQENRTIQIVDNVVYVKDSTALRNFINATALNGIVRNAQGATKTCIAGLRKAAKFGVGYDIVMNHYVCPVCKMRATDISLLGSNCDFCDESKQREIDHVEEFKTIPINPIEGDFHPTVIEAMKESWWRSDVEDWPIEKVYKSNGREVHIEKQGQRSFNVEFSLSECTRHKSWDLIKIAFENDLTLCNLDYSWMDMLPCTTLNHLFTKDFEDDIHPEMRELLERDNARTVFRSNVYVSSEEICPGWSGVILTMESVDDEDIENFDWINGICVVQGRDNVSLRIQNAMRIKTSEEMKDIQLYSFDLSWAKSKEKFIEHFAEDERRIIKTCCTPSALWLYARKAKVYGYVDYLILKESSIVDLCVKLEYVGQHLSLFENVEDACIEFAHFMDGNISSRNLEDEPELSRVRLMIKSFFDSVREQNKYEIIDRIIEKKTRLEADEIIMRELIRHQYAELFSWRERILNRWSSKRNTLSSLWEKQENANSNSCSIISSLLSKPGLEHMSNWAYTVCKVQAKHGISMCDNVIKFVLSRIVELGKSAFFRWWESCFYNVFCILATAFVTYFLSKFVNFVKKLVMSERKETLELEKGLVEVQGKKEEAFVMKWCAMLTLLMSFVNFDWAMASVSAMGKLKTIFSAFGNNLVELQAGDDDAFKFTTFEVEVPGNGKSSDEQTFEEWMNHCIKYNLTTQEPTTSGPLLTLHRGKAKDLAETIRMHNSSDLRVFGGVGSGKSTSLPSELMKFGSVLICVPTRVLANALHDSYMSLFGFDISVAYRGRVRTGTQPITVMTYGYALNHFHYNPGNLNSFEFVVMDEIHTFPTELNPLFSLIRETNPKKKIIKTSATHVGHNVELSTNHKVDIETLTPMGVKKWVELQGTNVFGDASSKGEVILVFVATYSEVDEAADGLRNKGFSVLKVDGRNFRKNTEVQKMVDDLPGPIKYIVATNIIENGVTLDVDTLVDFGERVSPVLDTDGRSIIMARRRISKAERQQRFGRVGRMKPGTIFKFGKEALPDSMKSVVGATESAMICFAYGIKPVVDDVDIGAISRITKKQALTATLYDLNRIFTVHCIDKHGFIPRSVHELFKPFMMRTEAVAICESYLSADTSQWRPLSSYMRNTEETAHVRNVKIPWFCSDMSSDFIVKLAECVAHAKPKFSCSYDVENVDFHVVAHKISVGEHNIEESKALVSEILNRVKQWRDNLIYKMSTPRNNSLMSLMVGWIPKKIEKTRSQLEMRIQRLEMLLSQLDNVSVSHDYDSLVRFFAENPHSAEYLEAQGKAEYLENKVLKTKIRETDWRVVAGLLTATVGVACLSYWFLRRKEAIQQIEIQGKVGYKRDKRTARYVFDGPDQDMVEAFGVEYSHDVMSGKMSKAQKTKKAKDAGWKIGKVDRPKKIFSQLYGVNPLEFDEVYMTVGDCKGQEWKTTDLDIDEMFEEIYDDFSLANRFKTVPKDVHLVFKKSGSDEESVVTLQPHRSRMASSMSLNPMGFPEEEGRWRQSGEVRRRKRIEEDVEVQVANPVVVSEFAHVFQRIGRLNFSGRGLNCIFHGDKSIMPYHLASEGDPKDPLIVTTSRGQFDLGPLNLVKCKKVSDYDLVVGQLPRDMQPFKATQILRKPKMDEEVALVTLKRDKGKMFIRTSNPTKIYKAEKDKYSHLWVHFVEGASGDCGGPLVALTDHKVVGFHNGIIRDDQGKFLRSVFTPVSDDLINIINEKTPLNDFWKFRQDAISWNAVIKTASLFPVTKTILGVHVQVGAGDKYIGGNLMTVGEVNKHAYSNHVIKGKRAEFLQYCLEHRENCFEKFRDSYGPSIMTVGAFYKDLMKYDEPVQVGRIDFPSLVHAFLNVEDVLLSLGFDEDCGPEWDPYEIYSDLNKKAAMGALYHGSKNEWLANITPEDFIMQVQESFRMLGHGVVGVWSGSLKAELRTKAKIAEGKTRVFTGAPVDVLLAGKILVDKFNKHFYSQHLKGPWSVGINKFNRGWNKLAEYFNHDWKFIDCDGSRFDSSLSPILFQMICHLRERFGHFDWGETNALRNLYAQIVYTPILTIDGNIVKKHRGNNSGQPSTVVDNTLILMLVVEYCKAWHYNTSGIVMKFKYMCNGDDLIINAPDSEIKIIQATFKNLFKDCGLNYDFDDLHVNIESVEYMSHHFMKRGDCYIPKLSKDRIVAILEWERSDEIFRTRSALNAAYIESFGYDDLFSEIEKFSEYWAKMKGVDNVLMKREHVESLYLDDKFELTEEIINSLSPASFEFGYVELQADTINKEEVEKEIEDNRKLWFENRATLDKSPYQARKDQKPYAEKVDELLKKLKDAGIETRKRPCGVPNADEKDEEDEKSQDSKGKRPMLKDDRIVRRDDVDKIPTNALEFKKDFKPARASRTSYIWIPRSQRDNLTPDVVKNFLAYIPPSQAIDNQMASGTQVENWAVRTASAYGVSIQQFYETVLPAWIVNCIVNGTSDERKTETVWRAVELNSQGEDVDDMEYPIEPIYKHALPTMRKIMRNFSSQAILMYQNSVAEGKAFTVKGARNAGYSEMEDQWLGIDFLAEAQLSRNQLNIKHQILAANVSRGSKDLFALAAPSDQGRVNAERHLTTDATAHRHTYSGAQIE